MSRDRSRRRPLPLLLLTLLGLPVVLGVALASPASAHASLVSSDPEDGARLATAPAQVSFSFSESMAEPAYVVVTGPGGRSATTGRPTIEGAVVVQRLASGLPAGAYTMAYRAVSADGHPVSGELSFTVAGASAPETLTPSASTTGSATAMADPSTSPSTSPSTAPAAVSPDSGDDSSSARLVGIPVAVVVVGGGLWALSRRRRAAGGTDT